MEIGSAPMEAIEEVVRRSKPEMAAAINPMVWEK